MSGSREIEVKPEPPLVQTAQLRGRRFNRLGGVKVLKTGVLPKSERGHALAKGDAPRSFKAGPIALKPDLSTADAFRVIARACIRHFRLNEPLLIASRATEPLHQARVAIRRLRSALSLFEPIVTDQEYKRLKRRLREVSHQLGEARNLDVYIAHTTVPNAGENGDLPPFALNSEGRVQGERNRAYERIIGTLRSKRFRQLMQDFAAWMEGGAWCIRDEPERQAARDQPIEDFASRVLDRGRRKVKRGGRHLERLSPKKRHRVRIEAKKLRYASEFFADLLADRECRKRHKSFVAALEDLQTYLGELNDIQTGHEIAAELAGREAAPASGSHAVRATAGNLDEQDSRAATLLSSACKAYHRFSGIRPFWKS
jgi:CHAD domain-containing protein